MKVDYVDHMGSDLTVVNAARVSFAKRKDKLDFKDHKLIYYLARNGHWTPFAHPQVTLKLKVPFFVANQIKKHQVGFVVNEVSRRYVDSKPEFFTPKVWRRRADDKKQGSSDEPIYEEEFNPAYLFDNLKYAYLQALDYGVCPEQARLLLPMAAYTEFWMTGSLYGWANLYNLRSKPDTQRETQEVAGMIKDEVSQFYPVSWEALTSE